MKREILVIWKFTKRYYSTYYTTILQYMVVNHVPTTFFIYWSRVDSTYLCWSTAHKWLKRTEISFNRDSSNFMRLVCWKLTPKPVNHSKPTKIIQNKPKSTKITQNHPKQRKTISNHPQNNLKLSETSWNQNETTRSLVQKYDPKRPQGLIQQWLAWKKTLNL